MLLLLCINQNERSLSSTSCCVMFNISFAQFVCQIDHLCYFCLLQAAAYGSVEGHLTEDMMDSCVSEMISQHKQKVKWEDGGGLPTN